MKLTAVSVSDYASRFVGNTQIVSQFITIWSFLGVRNSFGH